MNYGEDFFFSLKANPPLFLSLTLGKGQISDKQRKTEPVFTTVPDLTACFATIRAPLLGSGPKLTVPGIPHT